MENFYTINEVATMTGLTTRTIRNYLKSGLINGEKINGIWMFSSEDFEAMLNNPAIKPSIQAKDNESEEISQFFCNTINSYADIGDLSFKFEKHGRNVRVILSGADEVVMEIMNRYYDN